MCFVFFFWQLETDTRILLEKAEAALKKYKMHAVVANELSTRKQEVTVVTSDGVTRVCRENEVSDVEKPLIDLLSQIHVEYIERCK